MTEKRKTMRAESLVTIAEEFGVTTDTLISWLDQTTLIGMIKAGWNPYTMPRLLPPSVAGFLRKRWGTNEQKLH